MMAEFRTAVVAALAAGLEGVEVRAHSGRFTQDSLKQLMVVAPAVRVALLGLRRSDYEHDAGLQSELTCAAYLVTRDTPGKTRDEHALELVDAVIGLVSASQFGFAGVLPARNIDAQNLYDGDLQTTGTSLWAISWVSPIQMTDGESAPIADWEHEIPEIGIGHRQGRVGGDGLEV